MIASDAAADADLAYARALRRLLGLTRFGVKLGLDAMERVLADLSQPQRRYGVVHLAGTNGKGSTAAMVDAALRGAGVRSGLYTSPHLCRFTERIRVCGEEIPRPVLAELAQWVMARHPGLTFFEVATAVAFRHFADAGVEVAVVETGLGGRLDATNVVRPAVSVITRLGLDHTNVLGPDLASVAREKAGIVKPGAPVVLAPVNEPAVEDLLRRTCAERGSPAHWSGEQFALHRESGGELRWRWGERLVDLDGAATALGGDHQLENGGLALAALELLAASGGPRLSPKQLGLGLGQVRWPGRMHWLEPTAAAASGGDGATAPWPACRTLVDGAHNPLGVEALARALPPPGDPGFSLILGLLRPRRPETLFAPLLPRARRLVTVAPESSRAWSAEELAALLPGARPAASLAEALALTAGDPWPRLITGSLYLAGEALRLLAGEPGDPLVTADPLGVASK